MLPINIHLIDGDIYLVFIAIYKLCYVLPSNTFLQDKRYVTMLYNQQLSKLIFLYVNYRKLL
jgi:hypothetical protein